MRRGPKISSKKKNRSLKENQGGNGIKRRLSKKDREGGSGGGRKERLGGEGRERLRVRRSKMKEKSGKKVERNKERQGRRKVWDQNGFLTNFGPTCHFPTICGKLGR